MKFNSKDLILVKQGSKTILGRPLGKTTMMPQGSTEPMKFAPEDLVAVTAPIPGAKIFGNTILPHLGMIKLSRWEAVMHTILADEDQAALTKAFNAVSRKFKESGLATGFPCITGIPKVMNPTKTFSSYSKKWNKADGGSWGDFFTISSDPAYYAEASSNVLANNVWHHMLNEQLRAKWIALYDKVRAVHSTSNADLELLLETYLDQEQPSIRGLKDIVDLPNIELIVKSVISTIKTQNRITEHEIDTLACFEQDAVGRIWPKAASFAPEKASFPVYAMKDARNMFAFAMYQHFFGTVPESLAKAVRVTIKNVGVKTNDEDDEAPKKKKKKKIKK